MQFSSFIFSGLCRVWKHDFVAGNLVDHNSEPIFHILVLEDVRRFYSRKDDEKKHSFRELEREVRAPKGLRHLDQGCHLKTGLPTNWCHQDLLSLTYFVWRSCVGKMIRAKETAWHWVPTSLQQVIDDEELPSHVRVVGISDAGRAAPISLLSCVMCVCVCV